MQVKELPDTLGWVGAELAEATLPQLPVPPQALGSRLTHERRYHHGRGHVLLPHDQVAGGHHSKRESTQQQGQVPPGLRLMGQGGEHGSTP